MWIQNILAIILIWYLSTKPAACLWPHQTFIIDAEAAVHTFLKIGVIYNIHREPPVLESLFNKIVGPKVSSVDV